MYSHVFLMYLQMLGYGGVLDHSCLSTCAWPHLKNAVQALLLDYSRPSSAVCPHSPAMVIRVTEVQLS